MSLYNGVLNPFPERPAKPRKNGLTMVMDKGLTLKETEDFCDNFSDYVDVVKLGFGTSLITKKLKEKVAVYKKHNILVKPGGTLFEAFIIRNQYNDFRKFIEKYEFNSCEVSDGSISLEHSKKCNYIKELAKDFTVFSEVGSKESGIFIHPNKWISNMEDELSSGAFKVIAEARESGNVGIYRSNGTAHVALVNKIITQIKIENILWESPLKSQQAWFIKTFKQNVNLGNISPKEVLSLEALRLGVRGDTFFDFLDYNE